MRLYDWLKKLNLIDKTWIDPEVDTGTNIVNPKSVTAMGHFCNVNCKISVIKMTKKRDSLDPSPGPQLVFIGPGPQFVFTSPAQCCTTTTTTTATCTVIPATTTTITTTTIIVNNNNTNSNYTRFLLGSKIRIKWALKGIWWKSQVLFQ